MSTYCDIEGCETEAMEEVEVLCYPCYEAYRIGVQHGEFRHGKPTNKKTTHRSDGYASPVYHASPWRIGYPRDGAAPIRKIKLPPGHPSGVEEEQLLCELHVKSREWWTWVAKELEQPLIVLQVTNGGKP